MNIRRFSQVILLPSLAMSVFLDGQAFSLTTPVIVSAVVDSSTSEISVKGSNFEPAAEAPAVVLDAKALLLVSYTNQSVQARLPASLAAGTYLLQLTNSSGNSATFAVTIGAAGPAGPEGPRGARGAPGPRGPQGPAGAGQIFANTYTLLEQEGGWSISTGLTTFTSSSVTIMPADCTISAVYASLAEYPEQPLPSVSVALQKNSESTDFPVCQPSSLTAKTCKLPDAPISVSAGDTLNYVISVPAGGGSAQPVGLLNLSLLCQ
jgi:hypothetical protein